MQAFEISWIVATFLLTLKEALVVFAQCTRGQYFETLVLVSFDSSCQTHRLNGAYPFLQK